jgi:diketogulonate reductase-like aldo/keto reductase
MHEKLILNETLTTIAACHRKTVPQVILRWNYQHSIPTIPKTSNHDRLRENIDIHDFSLTDEEMASIDSLNIDFRVRFDPDNCDFSKL